MENTILNIIDKNYNEFRGVNEAHIGASKEIASHVKKFIDWKDNNTVIFFKEGKTRYLIINDDLRQKWLLIDEIYRYWIQFINI
jgi:uncharacterized HAD superfamily protein